MVLQALYIYLPSCRDEEAASADGFLSNTNECSLNMQSAARFRSWLG